MSQRGGNDDTNIRENIPEADIENNLAKREFRDNNEKDKITGVHSKVLEPFRTDPVRALQARQRRLERLSTVAMPEVHFVGQIVSGAGIIADSTEGAFCR
jgi:hypothetical protein